MNIQNKLYKVTLAAMFAALIFVATAFLMIPLPGKGYANFGDCFVILSALMLGPVCGAAAAGIGSAISDLSLGYGLYAPATFIIKAAMGVVVALIYKYITKTGFRYNIVAVAISAFFAEVIMVLGYFVFEIFIFGVAVAVVDTLGNTVQGLVGLASGTVMFSALNKSGLISKISSTDLR
ncbi:MAG: ECF transporter S component [Oscillospiraceae bacterium]|nr:ECF transporter S component [Oscillospiraceae bacterium]MDD4414085.1 ECF transporter S component [Oscillospiraceae bacterium]